VLIAVVVVQPVDPPGLDVGFGERSMSRVEVYWVNL
jgi:hypothetical protein